MAEPPRAPATGDAWARARSLTPARIGLPRAGASLATAPLLELRLAHARARDAVHAALDEAALGAALEAIGWDGAVRVVDSAASGRTQYLVRPDLGRRLSPAAEAALRAEGDPPDLALVVADGLSARAVQAHAAPVLAALAPALRAEGWRMAPPVVVRQGRVAIGDHVAMLGRVGAVLVLIGERPGLSAPDSLGAYITWRPGAATTDADRNCISNIRREGIPPDEAAARIAFLLRRMRDLGRSGVMLKDESDAPPQIPARR